MNIKCFCLLICVIVSQVTFAQSIQTITDKIATKICDCMTTDMQSHDDIEPEFNRCYDQEFNQIFSIVDANEQKILMQSGALDKINKAIIPNIQKNCDKVRRLTVSELEKSKVDDKYPDSAFPINFNESNFKNLNFWNGKIVALQGKVLQVEESRNKTPYSKLRVGDQEIWAISMIDSGFEEIGADLKILGYLIPIEKTEYERKFNSGDFHILALGIVDLKTNELAYFPGSVNQIKQWIDGEIPIAKE